MRDHRLRGDRRRAVRRPLVVQFLIPGTKDVTIRPAFALVPFFGFAFGPIVGLFTGFVGNTIGDQISGWGVLTS